MDLSIVSFLSQAVTSPWVPIVPILVLEQPTGSFKRAKPGEHSSWFRAPEGTSSAEGQQSHRDRANS